MLLRLGEVSEPCQGRAQAEVGVVGVGGEVGEQAEAGLRERQLPGVEPCPGHGLEHRGRLRLRQVCSLQQRGRCCRIAGGEQRETSLQPLVGVPDRRIHSRTRLGYRCGVFGHRHCLLHWRHDGWSGSTPLGSRAFPRTVTVRWDT